jgi:gas vesicle protein
MDDGERRLQAIIARRPPQFEGEMMPVITDQQRKFYETTLQVTKQEISDLKDQIEEELAKVKDRIAELQNAINASKQMYAAACARLGMNNDMEDDEGGES